MLKHGGNLAEAALEFGIPLENWLDLSTGINPYGYPVPAIPPALWQRLPLENNGLIEAACAYYGCNFILPTAGSQAALQALPQLRSPCLVAMPNCMYQEHAHAWQRYGHTLSFFDAVPDEKTLNQADVMLLCNPNNPTATQFSPEYLLDLHATLAARGGWLIVDEAFIDATPEASISAHTQLEGLFVLRSLGKFFGLAGARVGFLLAPQHWLDKTQEIIGPWALTGASRYIATQVLSDVAWQTNTRIQLATGSAQLTDLLSKYGLTPAAKTELFQFVPTPRAIEIHQVLAKQGVWVRLFVEVSALRFGLPHDDAWDRLKSALNHI